MPIFRTGVRHEQLEQQRREAPAHRTLARSNATALSTPAPQERSHQTLSRTTGAGRGPILAQPTSSRPPPSLADALRNDFSLARPVVFTPAAHEPLSARDSTNSNVSASSNASRSTVHSDLQTSVYDPDEPVNDFDDGPTLSPEQARGRALDNMLPIISESFKSLEASGANDAPEVAMGKSARNLEKLFDIPLDSLTGDQMVRTFRILRQDVTEQGDTMLDLLRSDTGEASLDQLRKLPDANRAHALAAMTWACGADPFMTEDDPALRRALTLCAENKGLARQVDRHVQTLECRSDGHGLKQGLRVQPNRKAELHRLPVGMEQTLSQLGIRDYRFSSAPSSTGAT